MTERNDDDCRGYVPVFPGILVPYWSREQKLAIIRHEILVHSIVWGTFAVLGFGWIGYIGGKMAGWW